MSDWLHELGPDERRQWDEYVTHFRREVLQDIVDATFFASIAPKGEGDPKYWMELGAAIMFDKPLVVLAIPGTPIPPKLRKIADRIVFADIDTEAGREKAAAEFAEIAKGIAEADACD